MAGGLDLRYNRLPVTDPGMTMRYLPPFEIVKALVVVALEDGKPTVSCSYDDFVTMIRRTIVGIVVDEAWYLTEYPDIADAIERGLVKSAQDHFVSDGYFEGRQPFPMRVNERWYLMNNTGVADYVRQGKLLSGQQHVRGTWLPGGTPSVRTVTRPD